MAVYLKEVDNPSMTFTFPSEPDRQIEIRRTTNYQEYSFIGIGKRSYPKGMNLQPIKWSGYFFGASKKGLASHNTQWQEPADCINRLMQWQENGTPLNLIVSTAGVNVDVTIQTFNYRPTGGYGDVAYDIAFIPYDAIQIYTVAEVNAGQKKTKTNRSISVVYPRTYVIRSGETLQTIALKFYKNIGAWLSIYSANKDTIEQAARSHGLASSDKGKYIYAGTTLNMP